ncbi:MAG: NAD(P)-dependent oxidoreductase [Myxococcaceae bacterium]
MRLVVIGAHHGVGGLVVAQARAAGHDVAPFEGDVLDAAAVERAVVGRDAVISTLGPRKDSVPDLCSRGTRHVVDAMRGRGIGRIIQITGAIIGHPYEKLGWVYRTIASFVPEAALADRRMQEQIVRDSGLRWTLLRPTRLTDGIARDTLRTGEQEQIGAFAHVSRASVAAFAVRALTDETTFGRAYTLQE